MAESFCPLFSEKITSLRLSLQSLISIATIDSLPDTPATTDDSPPSPPPASLSTFQLTSATEIYHLLQSLPNKQCELDPIRIPPYRKSVHLSLSPLETDRNCIFHFRPKTKLAPKLTFWLGRKRKRKRNCIASFGRKRKRN